MDIDKQLDELGDKVRKIICKVKKHTGERLWVVSLYGERYEKNGSIVSAKDIRLKGSNLSLILKDYISKLPKQD